VSVCTCELKLTSDRTSQRRSTTYLEDEELLADEEVVKVACVQRGDAARKKRDTTGAMRFLEKREDK